MIYFVINFYIILIILLLGVINNIYRILYEFNGNGFQFEANFDEFCRFLTIFGTPPKTPKIRKRGRF